ncbi:MAG: DMT family transporter [Blastocatellia bacterium]|nr:DMT family transporter [Blastocatellia bacterium]
MKFGWVLLVLFSGLLVPMQSAINAKLRTFVVNPTYSAFISFLTGTLCLALVAGISLAQGQPGNMRAATGAPWWAWLGGLFGTIFVTCAILAIPRIGATVASASLIVGQLIAALILDHYGLLDLPKHPISPARIAGAVLLCVALWLIQKG